MRPVRKPGAAAGVLRNVVLQELPHALARPLAPVPRSGIEPVVQADTARYEQAFAEGYRQGAAAGTARLAEVQASLQSAGDEARQKGFEQGRAEGLQRARDEAAEEIRALRLRLDSDAQAAVQQKLQRLQDMLQEIAAQRLRLMADAEDDLVALGHEAICRMLGDCATTPQALQGMVRHLLAQEARAVELRAHVHPDDCAALEASGLATEGVTWIADAQVSLGGILLRSSSTTLDARLEVQLESLRTVLLQVRQRRRGGASR